MDYNKYYCVQNTPSLIRAKCNNQFFELEFIKYQNQFIMV